jgi:hypothetical protein
MNPYSSMHRLNFSNNFGIADSKNKFCTEQKYQLNTRTPLQIRYNNSNGNYKSDDNISEKFIKFKTSRKIKLNNDNNQMKPIMENKYESSDEKNNVEGNNDHVNCYCMYTPLKMLALSDKKFSNEELNNGINIQTPKLNYEEYTQTKFNYVSSNDLNQIENYIKTPSKPDLF